MKSAKRKVQSAKGALAVYHEIIHDLRVKARNAAARSKPTMWAYYERMAERLESWFADVVEGDGSYAGAALVLVQKAEELCPTLPRDKAADLWAQSVYAFRILNAWQRVPGQRRSLAWMRSRAGVARSAGLGGGA